MATEPGKTSSSSVAIETVDEFEAALSTDERVLAYFYADWCGPCQIVAPTVDLLASTTEVPVITVDVEALPTVASDQSIRSIPTFVVYENGVAADRLSGVHDASALRAALED